jgi:hypothetical protein
MWNGLVILRSEDASGVALWRERFTGRTWEGIYFMTLAMARLLVLVGISDRQQGQVASCVIDDK